MGITIVLGRLILVASAAVWLAGCVTTDATDNPFIKLDRSFSAAQVDGDNTAAVAPELLGDDPKDDLSIGKKYFRQGSYGLAERHFRKAVELHPRDAASWVGLAAAYDRLHRFDFADRAYQQAIKLIGETPELLNNQGFSYMLRGDYRRARTTLLAARAKDPKSPFIANNLKLLAESERKASQVN